MKVIKIQNRAVRKLLKEMAEVAGFLWQRGWAERNAGNISLNITGLADEKNLFTKDHPFFKLETGYPDLSGKVFLVSSTGSHMRDLARKPKRNVLLIRLNEKGNGYWMALAGKDNPTGISPTSELPTHLGIHQMIARKGGNEKTVLHTHVTELIALTQIKEYCNEKKLNRLFWTMHPETAIFVPDGVGFVPYSTPGSQDIADETLKALENHKVALWEKHGVFAIAPGPLEAFDLIDILAKSAKIFFLVRSAGYDPQGLTDEQLKILKALADKF